MHGRRRHTGRTARRSARERATKSIAAVKKWTKTTHSGSQKCRFSTQNHCGIVTVAVRCARALCALVALLYMSSHFRSRCGQLLCSPLICFGWTQSSAHLARRRMVTLLHSVEEDALRASHLQHIPPRYQADAAVLIQISLPPQSTPNAVRRQLHPRLPMSVLLSVPIRFPTLIPLFRFLF